MTMTSLIWFEMYAAQSFFGIVPGLDTSRSMCCTKAIVCVYTFSHFFEHAPGSECVAAWEVLPLFLSCFAFNLLEQKNIPACWQYWNHRSSRTAVWPLRTSRKHLDHLGLQILYRKIPREWCEKLQFCWIFAIFRCDKMKPGGLDVFRWTARCCAQLGSDSRCDIEMSHCCTAVFRSKQCKFSKVFVERFFMLKFLGLGFNVHVLLLMKFWLNASGAMDLSSS